jgi:hypothetical protein
MQSEQIHISLSLMGGKEIIMNTKKKGAGSKSDTLIS